MLGKKKHIDLTPENLRIAYDVVQALLASYHILDPRTVGLGEAKKILAVEVMEAIR